MWVIDPNMDYPPTSWPGSPRIVGNLPESLRGLRSAPPPPAGGRTTRRGARRPGARRRRRRRRGGAAARPKRWPAGRALGRVATSLWCRRMGVHARACVLPDQRDGMRVEHKTSAAASLWYRVALAGDQGLRDQRDDESGRAPDKGSSDRHLFGCRAFGPAGRRRTRSCAGRPSGSRCPFSLTCPWTVLWPFTYLSLTFPQPFCRPFTALSLTFPVPFTALSLLYCCPFHRLPLLFHRLSQPFLDLSAALSRRGWWRRRRRRHRRRPGRPRRSPQ